MPKHWPRLRRQGVPALLIFAAAPAFLQISGPMALAQDHPPERRAVDFAASVDGAEADVRARLVELRKAEDEGAQDIGNRTLTLLRAEARYRAAYSWDVQRRTLVAPDRTAFAEKEYEQARTDVRLADATSATRLHEYLKKTPGFLERATGYAASGLDVAVRARIEAQLRLLRIRESAAHEVLAAVSSAVCIDGHLHNPDEVAGLFLGRCTSRSMYRLASLARRLAASFPDNYLRNEVERAADLRSDVAKEMAALRNRLDMEEFRRIALSGLVVDPETGVPVSGVLRIRVAENAERSLVQYLDRAGKRGPYTKMWSGEPLRDLGKSFLAEIKTRPDYKMLRYIEVGETPSPQEFFLVAARVIRAEQEATLKAYNESYLGGSFDQVDLEQLLRVSNAWGTGSASIEEVGGRLEKFLSDMDEAHDALMSASKSAPAALAASSPTHFRLLREMGFIDGPEDDPAESRYVIPESQSSFRAFAERAQGGVDLPGKGMLSVLNLRNAFQAAVSVAVPELAAARLATMGRNVLATERALATAKLATEAAAGTMLDAALEIGFQWKDAKPGEKIKGVEWDRLILESVVLGTALQFTGGAVDATFTSTLKTLGAETPNSALYQLIKKRPVLARHVEAYARTALGLASDTALTTFYQMYVQGHMDSTSWTTVLMNSALSRAMATAVEQIRTPSATWEQVKDYIPEALRGHFDAEPRLRAEVLANINRQLALQREIIERFESRQEPQAITGKRLFADLASGALTWRELTKVIYPKLQKRIDAAMEELREMRETYFFIMQREAKRRAVADIGRHFGRLISKANNEITDRESALARVKELEAQRDRELALVRAEIIAPGSKDPTSDIDRSSRSAWVRRHLRALYESRNAYRTDGDVPTSARAFDVNEYIDVFPFITESGRYQAAMRGMASGRGGLSHGQAMEALSMAAAMRHMGPVDRDLFVKNRRNALKRKVRAGEAVESEIGRLDRQLAYAQDSLNASERVFSEMRKAVAARHPGRPQSEIDLLASDALYDRRMQEINDLQFELAQKEKQESADAVALRARIQRLMAVALRDGIETYSSPTGLDIVVNRVQQATVRGADGEERKMRVADRLNDRRFTLQGELSAYSERDAASVVNDQIMFIAEHVHAFNSGHESYYETGRALGKYLERAFLGLKIAGLDIQAVRQRSKADPHRRLLEAAEALVANKADPKGLETALTDLSRAVPRSPEAGMAELFWLIEKVLPGLEGMTGVLAREEPVKARSAREARQLDPSYRRMRMIVQRRWELERTLVRETGGPEMVVGLVEAELALAAAELTEIDRRLGELRKVGKDYLYRDWREAIRLQNAVAEHRVMAMNLPDPRNPLLAEFVKGQKDAEAKLQGMRRAVPESPADLEQRLYQGVPEYRRLENRKAYLGERIEALKADLKEEQDHARNVAGLINVEIAGRWTCTAKGAGNLSLDVRKDGDSIVMDLKLSPTSAGAITIDARRLWGELIGTWQTGSDGSAPAGLVSAFPTADGTELQFTDRSTNDPGLTLDWASIVCQREGAKGRMRDIEAGFITMSLARAHAGPAKEGYWELRTIPPEAVSGGRVASSAGSLSSLGFAPDLPGVELQIRRGRRLFKNRALAPGEYLAAVKLGDQVATRPMEIRAGETTTVTVRPAALKVAATRGRTAGWLEVRLHKPGERLSGLARLRGNDWHLVTPGAYDLELATPLGSVWLKGVELASGDALEMKDRLASLVIDRNALGKNVRVRRITVAGAAGHQWWGFGADGSLGPLPPGEYEVTWTENGKSRQRKMSLQAGMTVNVPLN